MGFDAQASVIQISKKTGDYSALSHADLCVLALTYALDKAAERERNARPSAEEVCGHVSFPSSYFSTNDL